MRWLWVGVVVLSGMATIGCPSEFGKDGRIAKAANQDAKEQIPLTLTRCSKARFEEVCTPGREDSPECQQCRQGGVP